MNGDALILQKFRGLYNTGLSTPHPQGLSRRFNFIKAPPVDDLIRFSKDECVIRDEPSFCRFIDRIPEKVMDFVPSPPPSNDPLLKRPKIDFDKLMVLVIVSHEPNCFIDLDIVGVEVTSKAMEVHCRYSEPGPVIQMALGYGAYCAAVTRRFDGEVVFVPYSKKPSRWIALVKQTFLSFLTPRDTTASAKAWRPSWPKKPLIALARKPLQRRILEPIIKPREPGVGDMFLPFAVKTGLVPDPAKSSLPSTRFAFKLYRELLREAGTANIFFSPASVMLCLYLLREGGTGETQAAIDRVLEIAGFEADALQSTVAAWKSVLQVKGPGLELEIANSVWCNQVCTPRSEYMAKVKQDHAAEVIVLDFGNPEAVDQINGWCSGKTLGRINSIVESLDPGAILLAINAVYFKDLWAKQFEPGRTREELFHTSDGRTVKTPLMSQHGSYSYYEESGFQAVRLGYKNSRLAMYVFLPAKSSSLQRFQENLSSLAWDKWMKQLEQGEGQIKLPRFNLAYSVKLKAALEKLGMGTVFAPGQARFDAICPSPPAIWVDEVLHRAFVEVDEKGTVAAAITGETLCFSSEPPQPFQMTVDRPFFFAIRDDHTGTIWFIGSVEEPHKR